MHFFKAESKFKKKIKHLNGVGTQYQERIWEIIFFDLLIEHYMEVKGIANCLQVDAKVLLVDWLKSSQEFACTWS